jgi:hypothetical protein
MGAKVILLRPQRKPRGPRGPYRKRNSAEHDALWREVGERLRLVRDRLGLSEPEAAAAMLITLRTYRKWERGERHGNNTNGVLASCRKHGMTLDWLFAGDGDPPRWRPRLVAPLTPAEPSA